jgi:hypothetical protein
MTEATTTTTEPVTAAPVDSLITAEPTAIDFTAGKPEGFPDDFWDADKKSPKTDVMFNAYNTEKKRADGLRVKLSKGEFEGKAPDDIKEYTLELSEELKPLVPDDDRMLNAARQAAKDAGFPKEAFNKFMLPVITELAKAKAEMDTPLSEEEKEAARVTEVEKLGPSGSKIVGAVGSFIEQLKASGTFSEAEAKTAKEMAYSADAVRVLNKLRMMGGGKDQVPMDIPIDVQSSRQDVEQKMAEAMLKGDEINYNKYSQMLAKLNN